MSCKACCSERWAVWAAKNAEKLKKKDKEGQARHNELRNIRRKAQKDAYNASQVAERASNRERYRAYSRKSYAKNIEIWKQDPNWRLACRLRSRIKTALKGGYKTGSAVHDLGCSIQELRNHLESQFQPGMTWENWARDGWHIDHIRPLANFDLADPEQYKQACHYSNLQPLWAPDNLRKSDNPDWRAA